MKNAIKSMQEFEDFLNSELFTNSPFSRLSEADLEFFKVQLKFNDNGFPGGYWGDLAKTENLTDSELGDFVSSIFGVNKDKFLLCLHNFGTVNGTCYSRPHYNCRFC